MVRLTFCSIVIALLATNASVLLGADEYELPPIEYSRSTPDNRVAKLQAALDRQEVTLNHEPRFGYLKDLLEQLEIHDNTQMLVFSKTSMQRNRISPRTPRAIYFNDDSYVGFCQSGTVIEIAAADAQLGTVFYTLDQTNAQSAVITRQTDNCLQCHGMTQTDGIPGHLVRSMFVGAGGMPILSEGSQLVDHATPIEKRWGGWYVSGTHGAQTHMGNFVVRDRDAPRPWKNDQGQNVTDLSERFPVGNYLSPHSDIVALLVFEQQTHVHNLLTKANFAARQALHYERGLKEALGMPENQRLESTTRRIASAGEKLVEGLLMVDEATLTSPITGTSSFAAEFARCGPHDQQGRSLRELDLQRRLFKYPCSYLIYSREYNELPPVMKEYVERRLAEILAGQNDDEKYAHLSPADRESIAAILNATRPIQLPSP